MSRHSPSYAFCRSGTMIFRIFNIASVTRLDFSGSGSTIGMYRLLRYSATIRATVTPLSGTPLTRARRSRHRPTSMEQMTRAFPTFGVSSPQGYNPPQVVHYHFPPPLTLTVGRLRMLGQLAARYRVLKMIMKVNSKNMLVRVNFVPKRLQELI